MASLIEEARRQNSFGDAAAASLDSRVAQIPTGGRAAPVADGSQSSALNTEFGRNARNTLMALPGAASVPGLVTRGAGMASTALGAAAPVARAAQAASPYAPVAAGAAALYGGANAGAPAPPAPAPVASTEIAGPPASAAGTPAQVAPTGAAAALGNITRTGNSYTGPANISGDVTINGAAPGGGGLVARAAEAMGTVPGLTAPATAPQVAAPQVRHSGNDWQSRNDLRNLEVSASSIKNLPEWQSGSSSQAWSTRPPQGQADPQGKIGLYRAAMEADLAKRGAQPAFDMRAAQENAATQREGMQQQGQSMRAAARLGLEEREVGLRERAAAPSEQQRSIIADPNATPEQRASARSRLADLSGTADPYLVVQGGQGIDHESGKAYNTPSSVFNRQTGQWVQQPGQALAMPAGMTKQVGTSGGKPVYEDASSKRFVAS